MIGQSFKGNKKNIFEYMHHSTPLPKQQQAMCVHADLALGWEQGQSAHTMAMCNGTFTAGTSVSDHSGT